MNGEFPYAVIIPRDNRWYYPKIVEWLSGLKECDYCIVNFTEARFTFKDGETALAFKLKFI